ncbi:MAG: methyltransferase domain-containing protein [Gemmatimonadales bacterium]|jgi:SAM-dependent methyltransferase
MTNQADDGWNAGGTYEDFMGRWSRPLAEEFIKWVDPSPGGHWLDVGAGTGALAAAICAMARPASVVASDPSARFIESAKQRLHDPRVTFVVAGAESFPRRHGGYDAIVSGLALNFFPDPGLAMEEQLDAVCPNGLVGAFVWDYADGMEFLRHFWDAVAAIEPEAGEMDEGRRFPICDPDSLESLLRSAGAERVRVASLAVPTLFSSFEDYWHPFLGGAGPAPSLVSTLSQKQRRVLVDELRRRLPMQESGRIQLQARAWAVVGRARV